MTTRGVSSPNEPRWLWLLWLSLVVMRCQPLSRALVASRKIDEF
ncbi:exlusion protein FxsA [Vibrio cholerae]|nr:exlusion protein FxsA [Vibrio cholerae]